MQNTNVTFVGDKVHLSPETVAEARLVARKYGWPNLNSIEATMSVDVYEMFREFLRQNGDNDLPDTPDYSALGTVRLDEQPFDELPDEDREFDEDDEDDK